MKMLVTGASGFLGSHAVKALLDAGHEVHASARSAERVRKALEPLGVADRVEIVEADVTDRERVRTALAGCNGVLHAAAIYSLDARDAKRMLEDNVAVTETVLGLAAELGLDPIIHVSSYGALVPCEGTMTAHSPLGEGAPPYQRSKAESERVARRLQDEGAPVVIVQPGMVWGPDDPAEGETTQLVRATLARKIPMAPKGRVPIVDVRDVARVFAAAAQPGKGPRRYLACGELVEMLDVFRIAADAGGVKPPRGRMPAEIGRAHV